MSLTLDLFDKETDGRPYAKGEQIFAAGDAAELMYVVLEGEVELSIRGHVVETVGPGGVLGEMALIEHSPRTATATAKTDCVLVEIEETRFLFMLQQTPYFALHLLRIVTERLRRADAKLFT